MFLMNRDREAVPFRSLNGEGANSECIPTDQGHVVLSGVGIEKGSENSLLLSSNMSTSTTVALIRGTLL